MEGESRGCGAGEKKKKKNGRRGLNKGVRRKERRWGDGLRGWGEGLRRKVLPGEREREREMDVL